MTGRERGALAGGWISRHGRLVTAFKTPNVGVGDALSFDAVLFDPGYRFDAVRRDPDRWHEIDIATDLDEVERMFDDKYLDPATGTVGSFRSRPGAESRSPTILRARAADAGCRE